jgi:hydroxymethylpyrimidine/phosphomethylpyrimidine kinase
MKPPPCVLTIAGSDSGAGAGIQADARTIQALGGYACTAITALTAQNTRGVQAWRPVPPALIAAQVSAVLDDLPIAAIKTGLLPGPAAIRALVAVLRRHRRIPLVIDPVIGSTGGTRFLTAAGVRVLVAELLPRAMLVTPNWPEAAELAGRRLGSQEDVEPVARDLAARLGCAVLLKGGHSSSGVCRDCLVKIDGSVHWFESPRVATRNTHGTGCVLSAAIAMGLARGLNLVPAVKLSHAFLQRALRAGKAQTWGPGRGPAFAGWRRSLSVAARAGDLADNQPLAGARGCSKSRR